jgi:acyl-coenzyme A synthetase/AMP-(fatty) acid ligase
MKDAAVLASWLHPRARLHQGETTFDAASLAALARHRAAAGERLLAHGHDLMELASGLAAVSLGAGPLWLLRGGLPPPEPAQPSSLTDGLASDALIFETSGTTGRPKRCARRLSDILARIGSSGDAGGGGIWPLLYDMCGFAGVQVVLTVLRGGGTLVAPPPGASLATMIAMIQETRPDRLSATPSFARALLMAGVMPPLRSITLGGETADQPVLDALVQRFPKARLRHIYATTELGRLFAVGDARAGFPAAWLAEGVEGNLLRIQNETLWAKPALLETPWVDTGDRVEIQGNRILFRCRNDNIVNIGGTKADPSLAEARLLALPGVVDAYVYPVANPITGFILAADLVAPEWTDDPAQPMTGQAWRTRAMAVLADLPPAARPRRLRLVPSIAMLASGKKARAGQGGSAFVRSDESVGGDGAL